MVYTLKIHAYKYINIASDYIYIYIYIYMNKLGSKFSFRYVSLNMTDENCLFIFY